MKILNTKLLTIETKYRFGNISNSNYRHFAFLYLCYGKDGFSLSILGLILTLTWGSYPSSNKISKYEAIKDNIQYLESVKKHWTLDHEYLYNESVQILREREEMIAIIQKLTSKQSRDFTIGKAQKVAKEYLSKVML